MLADRCFLVGGAGQEALGAGADLDQHLPEVAGVMSAVTLASLPTTSTAIVQAPY